MMIIGLLRSSKFSRGPDLLFLRKKLSDLLALLSCCLSFSTMSATMMTITLSLELILDKSGYKLGVIIQNSAEWSLFRATVTTDGTGTSKKNAEQAASRSYFNCIFLSIGNYLLWGQICFQCQGSLKQEVKRPEADGEVQYEEKSGY